LPRRHGVWVKIRLISIQNAYLIAPERLEILLDALREPPTDGLEERSVSFSAFGLGSRISTGGRRRGGEPEPHEQSKRLGSDGQVTLKAFGLKGETIETSCEGSLESICRVGERNEATADCARGLRRLTIPSLGSNHIDMPGPQGSAKGCAVTPSVIPKLFWILFGQKSR
jgi:hypothetical protein